MREWSVIEQPGLALRWCNLQTCEDNNLTCTGYFKLYQPNLTTQNLTGWVQLDVGAKTSFAHPAATLILQLWIMAGEWSIKLNLPTKLPMKLPAKFPFL